MNRSNYFRESHLSVDVLIAIQNFSKIFITLIWIKKTQHKYFWAKSRFIIHSEFYHSIYNKVFDFYSCIQLVDCFFSHSIVMPFFFGGHITGTQFFIKFSCRIPSKYMQIDSLAIHFFCMSGQVNQQHFTNAIFSIFWLDI